MVIITGINIMKGITSKGGNMDIRQAVPQVKEIFDKYKNEIDFTKLEFPVDETNKDFIIDINDTIKEMTTNKQ
jgi:hypothetical protein